MISCWSCTERCTTPPADVARAVRRADTATVRSGARAVPRTGAPAGARGGAQRVRRPGNGNGWSAIGAHGRWRSPPRRCADGGRRSGLWADRGVADASTDAVPRSRSLGGRRIAQPDSLAWPALYAPSDATQANRVKESATSYRKSPIQRLYLCDPALDCKTDRIGAGALTHRRSTLIVIRKARDRERQTLDERP